jgi:4-amino-4-deoxy-L-arabinose transferase-like glycosyltransferase
MSFPARPSAWLRVNGTQVALLAVLLAVGLIRARLLDAPLERDEGEYAVMGQLLLQGEAPFQSAWNMKLPGTAMAYAGSMAVFGQTVAGARLGLLFAHLFTVVLLFLLGRALLGNAGGLAAAAAHGVLALSPAMFGPFGHATHFVALFGSAGLLVLVQALGPSPARSGIDARVLSLPRLIFAGVLLGLATLMKQPGVVFVAFAAAWLALERWRRGRRLLLEEAVLLAGAAAPLLAVMAWVAAAGTFGRFWFWVVEYAGAYSGVVTVGDAPGILWTMLGAIVPPNAALVALALAGFASPHRRLLILLSAFSFLGVSAGLYFRAHYFLLALPAVALLVGAAAQAAADRLGARGAGLAAAAVVAACAQSAWSQRAVLFQLSPQQVVAALYGQNPFLEAVELGRYLEEHTQPGDRLAVLGSEPEIYFYARRRPATGYLYVYPLVERQPYALRMQEEFIADVERAAPPFIVSSEVRMSWLAGPWSERRLFTWADAYLAEHYEVAGRVVISRPDPAVPGGAPAPVTLYRRRLAP